MLLLPKCLSQQPLQASAPDGIALFPRHAQSNPRAPNLPANVGINQQLAVRDSTASRVDTVKVGLVPQPPPTRQAELS
tara:strand:- start:623 stop:856 length:234 start_codon:yes stop_codon:yes gene_type:complete